MMLPSSGGKGEDCSPFRIWLYGSLDRAGRLVRPLLILAILLAPTALEGLHPLGRAGIELVLLVLLSLWSGVRLAAPVPAPMGMAWFVWPAGLFLGWALLSVIPLPIDWANALSAPRAAASRETLAVLRLETPVRFAPLSLVPGDAFLQLLRWALLLGLVLVARDRGRSVGQRCELMHWLLLGGLLQAAIGIIHHLGHASAIFFIPSGMPDGGPFFGTFLNGNRNAAYFGLIWPIALSLGLARWREERLLRGERRGEALPWHARSPSLLFPLPFYGLVAALSIGGLIACRSRMAWMVMVITMVAFVLLEWVRAGRWKRAFWAGLGAAVVAVSSITLSWPFLPKLLSRWAGKPYALFFHRLSIWRGALAMIEENPIFGVGPGGFATHFSRFDLVANAATAIHGESGYVEVVAECGIVGGFIVLSWLVLGAIYLWRRRFWSDEHNRLGVPGLMVGLGGIAVHSLADVATRGFGTSTTAALMLGLLIAALEDKRRRDGSSPNPSLLFGSPPRRVLIPFVALVPLCMAVAEAAYADQEERAARIAFEKGIDWVEREPLYRAATLVPWRAGPMLWLGAVELARATKAWHAIENDAAGDLADRVERAIERSATAEHWLTRACLLELNVGHAQRMLSILSEVNGEDALALARARDAVRVAPSDHRNWKQLGRVLWRRGDRGASLRAYLTALTLAPEEDLEPIARALLEVSHNRLDAKSMSVLESGSPLIPFILGTILVEQDRYPEAAIWFTLYLNGRTLSFQPLIRIGWHALEHKDDVLALNAAKAAEALRPDLRFGYVIEANALALSGEIDRAVAVWDKVIALNPPSVNDALRAAALLKEAGRYDEALDRLNELSQATDGDPAVGLAIAELYRVRGEPGRAASILRELIRTHKTMETPRLRLGELYASRGWNDQAIEVWRACLALPDAARCRLRLAELLAAQGRDEDALSYLQDIPEQSTRESMVRARRLKKALLARRGDAGRAPEASEVSGDLDGAPANVHGSTNGSRAEE